MPQDNPDFWVALGAWLSSYSTNIYALFLSVSIALVRVVYGGGTRRQMALEATMCGLVTLTLQPVLELFGLPNNMSAALGGMVGFIGVEKLRELAIRLGEKKAGIDKNDL